MNINPVTRKELLQLTRSHVIAHSIVGVFLLLLVASAWGIVANMDSTRGVDVDAGRAVFVSLCVILSIVLFTVIPFNLFSRSVSEHCFDSEDILLTTALRPSAFFDGKVLSGHLLATVFFFGTMPFLLLAYLLHGIDTTQILPWTAAVAMSASVIVHLSLFVASVRLNALFRWALWLLGVAPLSCVALQIVTEFAIELHVDWRPPQILVLSSLTIAVNFLLRGLAIAQLSPRGVDRARPSRLTAAIVWLVLMAVFIAFGVHMHEPSNAALMFFVLMDGGFLVLAVFDLSSLDGLSPRILSDRPASRLRRLVRWPFTTGAESGLVFTLVFLGLDALLALSVLFLGHAEPDVRNFWLAAHIAYAYVLAALLIMRGILRLPALARRVSVRATGLATAIVLAVTTLIPSGFDDPYVLDANVVPFNLLGIRSPDFWSGNTFNTLSLHFHYAMVGLLVGLLIHARRVCRSLFLYVRDGDLP